MKEFEDLTKIAGQRLTGIGGQLRANLIPPLWREMRNYDGAKLRADLIAGMTVAVVTIPQAIGFALIVGLPVQAVLVTAIVGSVVCACYTSSRHLVFGPTNTISLILAGAVLSLHDVPLTPLEKVLLLGFIIGLIQAVAGLTRTGQLTQFISRTVIIAYTTAVGVLIATGQIANLLGMERFAAVNLPETMRQLVLHVAQFHFNPASAATGVTCLFMLFLLRRSRPKWPEGLIVLAIASVAAATFRLDLHGVQLVRDLGSISAAVPLFLGFPLNEEGLKIIPRITATAIAIALLGMLEGVAIAKTLAGRSGQRIDPNQELISMGFGNLVATAFGAMPGSASFVRSATQLQSGGRTQFATLFGSAGVLLVLLVLSPFLGFIPIAALAAYLISVAVRLINLEQISIARRATRSDAAVFWVTLLSALFLKLDTAIYVGVGFSLVLFLQKASAPTLAEHAFNSAGQLTEIVTPTNRNNPQVTIVHVEGDLFFGAADLLQEGVRRLADDPQIRVFILRMKNARHLDATTVMALGQLLDYLHSQNRHLLISGVHGDLAGVLKRSGLAAKIGIENLFPAEENSTLATRKALQRAQELIGAKPALRVFYQQAAAPT